MLLNAEITNLLAPAREGKIQARSHPVIGIPEYKSSIRVGDQTTDRNTVVVQPASIGLKTLEEVVGVGH
jgi:hypothetical protein